MALRKDGTRGSLPKVQAAIDAGDPKACLEALTPLQQRFCKEFIVDLNATKAALRAGYEVSSNANRIGYVNLRKPGIKFAIDGLMASREDELKLDSVYVIKKIMESLERSEETNQEQNVLRAAELLGKHLGLYRDRQEISGPDGEAIKMEQQTEQNVADFKSKLNRLVKRSGTGNVVEFPDPEGDGSS